MLASTKKPHIDEKTIKINHQGIIYQFPKKIAEKYRMHETDANCNLMFADINKKYTKPGALLRGIRIRENITQTEMARRLNLTQSDISQMENGKRRIGRTIAKRIERLFDMNYRVFLE